MVETVVTDAFVPVAGHPMRFAWLAKLGWVAGLNAIAGAGFLASLAGSGIVI